MTHPPSPPEFSILVPVRNGANYIAATLESLVQQTLAQFEVIIVNDGSTDDTAAIVDQFIRHHDETRFTIINGPAKGVSAARNMAFAQAKAPRVLFLDADDLLTNDALERFAATLDSGQNIAALGGVARIDEAGAPLSSADNRTLVPETEQLRALIAKNYIVNGGALAIRAEAVRKSGGYQDGMTYGEDWEFWCRLLVQGDLSVVPGARLLLYRQVASGANHMARSPILAKQVPCLQAIGANARIKERIGPDLARLIKARQIDIYWSGVRSIYQYRSKARACGAAIIGVLRYPASLLRPDLAWRLLKSLKR